MMVKAIYSSVVTVERLERALVLLAYAMECDGPVYAPLFDKLERELETLRSQQDTLSRAKRLLASYTVAGGVKAIC
jgi:hypothetical protein